MKAKDEVKKEESKLREGSLKDLQIAEEQANETRGGSVYKGETEILSWSFGSSNPSNVK